MDHNPVILEKIINLKTTRGTYQYLKDTNDIEASFEAIRDMVAENYLEINIESQILKIRSKIELTNSKNNQRLILFGDKIKEIFPSYDENKLSLREFIKENKISIIIMIDGVL